PPAAFSARPGRVDVPAGDRARAGAGRLRGQERATMADGAKEHFSAGRLGEALAAATAQVRSRPTDVAARVFLAELLCFAGELERADKQLDLVADQDTTLAVGVALFRQLIRGEQARQQF